MFLHYFYKNKQTNYTNHSSLTHIHCHSLSKKVQRHSVLVAAWIFSVLKKIHNIADFIYSSFHLSGTSATAARTAIFCTDRLCFNYGILRAYWTVFLYSRTSHVINLGKNNSFTIRASSNCKLLSVVNAADSSISPAQECLWHLGSRRGRRNVKLQLSAIKYICNNTTKNEGLVNPAF